MKKIYNFIMLVIFICLLALAYNREILALNRRTQVTINKNDESPQIKESVKPKLYTFANDRSWLVHLILNLVPQPPNAEINYDTRYMSLLVTNTPANLKLTDAIVSSADNPQGVIERFLWSKGKYRNSRYGFEIQKPAWVQTTTLSAPGPVVTPPCGVSYQFGMTFHGEKSTIRFLTYRLKESTTSQDYALARKIQPEPEFANGWVDKKKDTFRDGAFFGIPDSYRIIDVWTTGKKEFFLCRIHLVRGNALYEIVQVCPLDDYKKLEEQNLLSFVDGLKFFQPVVPAEKVKDESDKKSATKVITAEGDPYKKDLETAKDFVWKKDYTQAIQILEKVVEKKDAGTRGEEALFQIGYILRFCLREYDKAIKVFEDFIKKYPMSPSIEDAERAIPVLYFNKGKYKMAEERFLQLLEKYPTKETADFIKHYLYVMKNCKEKKI